MRLLYKIQHTLFNQLFATVLLVSMGVQWVWLESTAISPIKVAIMLLALGVFFVRVPLMTKACWTGILYWLVCFFTSFFQGDMRFSTLGYLGLFLIAFITYYNLIYTGALSLCQFKRILKFMIVAYCVVLMAQQVCMIIGLSNFPLLNIYGYTYYEWNRLPSLSVEPSHSARIMTAAMLGFIRCLEVESGNKVSVVQLMNKENRWVTICYLWLVLMMGSGTAFIGLGLLCLYFIRWQTAIYMIPLLVGLIHVGQMLEVKQLERAWRVTQVTLTGDVEEIQAEDGSAASRIIPIINTLKMDLTQKESWFGKGTSSHEHAATAWMRTTDKIAVVEQYGLIALIMSLLLVYSCAIRKFFCLETVVFLILFGMSLINIYYVWGAMMIFTAVRYFQIQHEKGLLIQDDELYEER